MAGKGSQVKMEKLLARQILGREAVLKDSALQEQVPHHKGSELTPQYLATYSPRTVFQRGCSQNHRIYFLG